MTTNQKDPKIIVENNNNKKDGPQQPSRSKKNKKMFVYKPEQSKENKVNQYQPVQFNQSNESKNSSQDCNKSQKKNKNQFVYTPEKIEKESDDQRKQIENDAKENKTKKNNQQFVYTPEKIEKENQPQPKIVEFAPVTIPVLKKQNKSELKECELEKKENLGPKNNKKKFFYNPNEDKDNNKVNKKCNMNTKDKEMSSDEKEKEREKDSIINIKIDIDTSDLIQCIPAIRDALFSALDKNIDIVRFIPGKELKSNTENSSILRILVLLTSKRLGFDSVINPDNDGIITCKISSRVRNSAFVPHMPNKDEQEDLNRNDTLLKAFGMKSGDYLNIDNLSFRAVKRRFPHMPTICIGIICVKRTPKEAVEFAQLFEDSLRTQAEVEITRENDDDELLSEMKIIKLLAEKYGFKKEIMKHIYDQKRTSNNSKITLDRFNNDISDDFFKYLASLKQ